MTDARIPVVFGPAGSAEPGDALLFEGEAQLFSGATATFVPGPLHAPGCACCAARSAAGRTLAGLLHARARNEVPFFRRVLVVLATEGGRKDIEAALANDPVASTCFRAGV